MLSIGGGLFLAHLGLANLWRRDRAAAVEEGGSGSGLAAYREGFTVALLSPLTYYLAHRLQDALAWRLELGGEAHAGLVRVRRSDSLNEPSTPPLRRAKGPCYLIPATFAK